MMISLTGRFLGTLLLAAFMASFAQAEETNDFVDQKFSQQSQDEINRLINDQFKKFLNIHEVNKLPCEPDMVRGWAVEFFDHNFTNIGNMLRDQEPEYKIDYHEDVRTIRIPKSKIPSYLQRKQVVKDKSNPAPKISSQSKTGKLPTHLQRDDDPSIYRHMPIRGCCVSTVNVNNIVIGIDKIDHFFGNGGILFKELLDRPNLTEKQLLDLNAQQENTSWGLIGQGVKSYGDLNANWAGLNFYRNLIGGNDSVLSCADGKLKMNKPFKIENYVHVGWREAVNCSSFPKKTTAERFAKNLTESGYQCPQSDALCDQLLAKYPDRQQQAVLVSPVCRNKIPLAESVEQPSALTWNDLKKVTGGIRVKDVLKTLEEKGAEVEKQEKAQKIINRGNQ